MSKSSNKTPIQMPSVAEDRKITAAATLDDVLWAVVHHVAATIHGKSLVLMPVASGLSIMLVPVVGVFGGALTLGEVVAREDIMALGFILLAMALVLAPRKKSE